jgi:hypothetical protein
MRAVAGDLVAIAGGVACAYVLSTVWLYRKAFRALEEAKPSRPRSVP